MYFSQTTSGIDLSGLIKIIRKTILFFTRITLANARQPNRITQMAVAHFLFFSFSESGGGCGGGGGGGGLHLLVILIFPCFFVVVVLFFSNTEGLFVMKLKVLTLQFVHCSGLLLVLY